MDDDSINEWWKDINDGELIEFIQNWFSEIDLDNDAINNVGLDVVAMNFLAPDEFQWNFIIKSFSLATDARYLEAIAAGPIEHLLSRYGERWISHVESAASANDNFAWMMTNVWQHEMSENIWNRVKVIQQAVNES